MLIQLPNSYDRTSVLEILVVTWAGEAFYGILDISERKYYSDHTFANGKNYKNTKEFTNNEPDQAGESRSKNPQTSAVWMI